MQLQALQFRTIQPKQPVVRLFIKWCCSEQALHYNKFFNKCSSSLCAPVLPDRDIHSKWLPIKSRLWLQHRISSKSRSRSNTTEPMLNYCLVKANEKRHQQKSEHLVSIWDSKRIKNYPSKKRVLRVEPPAKIPRISVSSSQRHSSAEFHIKQRVDDSWRCQCSIESNSAAPSQTRTVDYREKYSRTPTGRRSKSTNK